MNALLGNAQYVSGFLNTEPTEESQLDHAGLAVVDGGKRLESFLKRKEFRLSSGHRQFGVERYPQSRAAPFLRHSRTRSFDQYTPHDSSANCKKMSPILPADIVRIDQAQPRFINEGCRLQRVLAALAIHVPVRDAPQFVRDCRD
jgi:hypothetical protein